MQETEDPIQRRVQKVLETRYENNKVRCVFIILHLLL